MTLESKRPGLAGTGAEEYQTTSVVILHIPSRNITRCCIVCRIPFRPLQPSHRLCRDCWRWCRIGQQVEELSRMLREVAP